MKGSTFSFQSLKCAISQIKYIEETISENYLSKKELIIYSSQKEILRM